MNFTSKDLYNGGKYNVDAVEYDVTGYFDETTGNFLYIFKEINGTKEWQFTSSSRDIPSIIKGIRQTIKGYRGAQIA